MKASALFAGLRGVLCDIERRVSSDEWLEIDVYSLQLSNPENRQRDHRRWLDGLAGLAAVLRSKPDFELTENSRPAEIAAFVALDPVAAEGLSFGHPTVETHQGVFVSTRLKVLVYVDNHYMYTARQGSPIFLSSRQRAPWWHVADWSSWPLADVIEFSDHALGLYPDLAARWREESDMRAREA